VFGGGKAQATGSSGNEGNLISEFHQIELLRGPYRPSTGSLSRRLSFSRGKMSPSIDEDEAITPARLASP
jgi:hypothetical protein